MDTKLASISFDKRNNWYRNELNKSVDDSLPTSFDEVVQRQNSQIELDKKKTLMEQVQEFQNEQKRIKRQKALKERRI